MRRAAGRGYGKREVGTMMATMSHAGGIKPRTDRRPVCPAAAVSFSLGLVALRLCWMPGVNCALALAALGAGLLGCVKIARSRGGLCGFDEAVSGMVLGVVVLGLSVFFVSAFVAAWH